MRTISQLAAEAVAVQDACNPLGVSKSYAAMLTDLWDAMRLEGQVSTGDLCNHPINRLWASKLHDLASMGLSDCDRYGAAYTACRELSVPAALKDAA